MSRIYEIFGTDAHYMTVALMEAASVADMIPSGASVALKPNLVVSGSPDNGATTHAGVLSGCIEYLQGHGIRNLSVIESSWVGDNTGRAMKACGYDKVCDRYGVPFYDLKKDKARQVQTPLRPMQISGRALDADFLIDLPVLKGHCQTRMTCALKNLKGCLPDGEKRRFHTEGLMQPIAALASALRPKLTIVDSICGDLDFEEGGNPVHTNRMVLGTDPVQVDAYGCQLMGLSVEDVPSIGLAERWGVGSTHIAPGDVVTLNEPQEARGYPAPSGTVKNLTRCVRENSACSACYAALVRGLYIAKKQGVSIDREIAIGQGWRGQELSCPGVGNCCAGAVNHAVGCPPTASEIVDLLKSVKIGKGRSQV